jgi:hypothetical protein
MMIGLKNMERSLSKVMVDTWKEWTGESKI